MAAHQRKPAKKRTVARRKAPPALPIDPVLGATVQAAVVKAVDKVGGATDAAAVVEALGNDPKFVNASNSEHWYQSGIQYGGSTAILASLFIVGAAIRAHGFDLGAYDQVTFIPALIALAGGIFTLVRRFVPGLRPLFSKGT